MPFEAKILLIVSSQLAITAYMWDLYPHPLVLSGIAAGWAVLILSACATPALRKRTRRPEYIAYVPLSVYFPGCEVDPRNGSHCVRRLSAQYGSPFCSRREMLCLI